MSGADLILNNPVIVVSLVISGLILLAASGLTLFVVLRAYLRRQKHRAELAQVIDEAVYLDDGDLDDTIPAPPIPRGVLAAAKKSNPAAEAPTLPVSPLTKEKNVAPPPAAQPAASGSAAASPDADAVSDSMQDIMSDVFVNEEASRRYTVLMKDKTTMQAADLLDLSRGLMARLAQTRIQNSNRTTKS